MVKLVKIALVDDHMLVLSSLEKLVNTFDGFHVNIKASNGQDLIEQLSDSDMRPDIILLDNNMPVMNGFETLKWIRSNHPLLPVLILSMEDDENMMIKMIRIGANGYLLKDCNPDDLKWALNEVLDKGYHYTKKVNGALKEAETIINGETNHDGLKDTEIAFIKLACTDLTYKEIADVMMLSPKTIDGYRHDLFAKLNIKNRVGLALYAVKNNLIDL